MKSLSLLFLPVCSALVLVFAVSGYAQTEFPGVIVHRYATRRPVDVNTVEPFREDMILNSNPAAPSTGTSALVSEPIAAAITTGTGGNIFGLNTVPTFSGAFVFGDSAWAEFYWDFNAKFRKDGSSITTHGRETQVYWKTQDGWRLVHVHYSGMPQTQQRSGF